MAAPKVYTAPKAFIKIDNEVAGYCRNLNFSENVTRANVQGLGNLTLQEAPAVSYLANGAYLNTSLVLIPRYAQDVEEIRNHCTDKE